MESRPYFKSTDILRISQIFKIYTSIACCKTKFRLLKIVVVMFEVAWVVASKKIHLDFV